jgi:hypothetical protein
MGQDGLYQVLNLEKKSIHITKFYDKVKKSEQAIFNKSLN